MIELSFHHRVPRLNLPWKLHLSAQNHRNHLRNFFIHWNPFSLPDKKLLFCLCCHGPGPPPLCLCPLEWDSHFFYTTHELEDVRIVNSESPRHDPLSHRQAQIHLSMIWEEFQYLRDFIAHMEKFLKCLSSLAMVENLVRNSWIDKPSFTMKLSNWVVKRFILDILVSSVPLYVVLDRSHISLDDSQDEIRSYSFTLRQHTSGFFLD